MNKTAQARNEIAKAINNNVKHLWDTDVVNLQIFLTELWAYREETEFVKAFKKKCLLKKEKE